MSATHTPFRRPKTLFGIGLLAAGLAAPEANAAIYCVDTAAELNSAMASANNGAEGSVQDIRLQPGTYNVPNGLQFSPAGDKDNKDFSISGGWNAGCTFRTTNPAATQLNAENGSTDGNFSFNGNHQRIVVEALSFRNFNGFGVSDTKCGPYDICPDTTTVRVRYNEFRNGRGLFVQAFDALNYSFSNNLVANNTPYPDNTPVSLNYEAGESKPTIAHNTFADLACSGTTAAAVEIRSRAANSYVHHNLFESSCGADLDTPTDYGAQPLILRNNVYGSRIGSVGSAQDNIVTQSPGFANAGGGDFHLRETAPASVAINAGMTPSQATLLGLSLPSQDLDGPAGTRVIGSRVDIGAYESSVNDASILTVTSANDSGAGTLRAALASANAAPGAQRIEFDIPGVCPRLIALESPLPDITDSVEIDGYSQPGAQANTQSIGTDAELCIVVLSDSTTLAQALQVPEAAPSGTRLSVQGIGFAGATGFNGNFTVAIRLRGGRDHLIQGNAFAGTGPGSIGSLGFLNFGLQIRGSAQNVTVGGPEPEHRNSFGAMLSSAIVLNDATSSGHTLQNNYFGLSSSGVLASPIELNGIFASASPDIQVLDNVFAAIPNAAALSITGASATGYVIRGNKFGTAANGIPAAHFRNQTGIQIASGSGDHEIGSLLGLAQSNLITNSKGAGVWILGSAGSGTLVRPNRIYGNGVDGVGLGIDLGSLGPLANDANDGDGGGNGGQNWPTITASLPNGDGTRQVSVALESTEETSFRIDVYRSPDCPGGDRGGNMLNRIGTVTTTTGLFGDAAFDVALSGAGSPGFLVATATNLATGDTSEPSPCFEETLQTVLLVDGFE
jgi:hypothetical protein